jgi:hypothetical protein
MLPDMAADAEVWIPLVDEPIGAIVEQVRQEDDEIAGLVGSPRALLAFRTFAYIRVGILLGSLLVDHDVEPEAGTTWVEQLAAEHHDRVVAEVRAVAREVASEGGDPLGPSDDERARFSDFAKRRLATDT